MNGILSLLFVLAAYAHLTSLGFPTALWQLLIANTDVGLSWTIRGFLKMISLWCFTAAVMGSMRQQGERLSRKVQLLAEGMAVLGLWYPLFYREETQGMSGWIMAAAYLAAAFLAVLAEKPERPGGRQTGRTGIHLLQTACFDPVKYIVSGGLVRQWLGGLKNAAKTGGKAAGITGRILLISWVACPVLGMGILLAAQADVYFQEGTMYLLYQAWELLGIWSLSIGLMLASSYAVVLEASWLYGMCGRKDRDRRLERKKLEKRKYLPVLLAAGVAVWGLCHVFGYHRILQNAEEQIEVELPFYVHMEYWDDHGGFFRDGTTRLVLTFSEEGDRCLKEQMENSPNWQLLPMTEKINTFLYGEQTDGYGYIGRAEELKLPVIRNGYWYFLDRHTARGPEDDVANQPHNDQWLLSRGSYNVTVAIYDMDTRTLYFLKYDT